MMPSEADISQLLLALNHGDQAAMDELVPLIYEHLRQLARARLRNERPGHTLNTTALVHEAYLRLADVNRMQWQGRAHFMAMAARIMRHVLVDYAERRNTLKRGGGQKNLPFDEEALLLPEAYAEAVTDLHEALKRLEKINPRMSQAVEQRYFGGLKLKEIAEVLGVSLATVKRDLRFALAWLADELGREIDL